MRAVKEALFQNVHLEGLYLSVREAAALSNTRMPVLDKLAAEGLRYNGFHTTALCSPTRMALLTGRNHHVTNTGAIMELATVFPGNTGIRPQSVAPSANEETSFYPLDFRVG